MSDTKDFVLICLRCGEARKGRCTTAAKIVKRFCAKCGCDTNHNLRPADAKSKIVKLSDYQTPNLKPENLKI